MTTETRCELTELLVDQCACRHHRGGRTVEEEADADRLALRGRLLSGPVTDGWLPAIHPGRCARCGHGFGPGTAIRLHKRAGSEARWIAECCAEEADSG